MHQITREVLNFFYPNVCPKCNAFLLPEELLCDSCAEKILLEQDAYCHQCGKENCICKYQTFAYDKVVAACRYDKETAPAVISLKMSKNTNFAYFSARILAERLKHGSYYQLQTISCVMPVPMHISKQRKRGYNQAALIAKELARLLQLPYREDALFKERSEVAQHTLSAEARTQNVASFGIHDVSLEHQCILLCDDVLTTGSTMNRCAELLKSKQASTVIAAAASSTTHKTQESKKEKIS